MRYKRMRLHCEDVVKKFVATLCAVLLLSASAEVSEPIAAGFVNWTGLNEKNHIAGRSLTPSDMRHRITVIVELQASDFKEQAIATAELAGLGEKLSKHVVVWEDYRLPRCLVVYSVVGKLPNGAYGELRKQKTQKSAVKNAIAAMCVYQDVSFNGCPQSGGKYPFVYIMGPDGDKPLYAGQYGKGGLKKISGVVKSAEKKLPAWRTYFGAVSEDNHYPQLAKSLEKGQPTLTSVLKDIQKGIGSKNEDLSRESQVLYDAINQRRSDLEYLIALEAERCPHMAYVHMQELFARWPSSKKALADTVAKLKAIPDLESVSKIFVNYHQCADPEFVPKSFGEAKKLSAQLLKQKPILEKLKESKNPKVQNAAFKMLQDIESVAEALPSRTLAK